MEALHAHAKEIESLSQTDVHKAADDLLHLTSRYSIDLKLKKRALKLNWDLDLNSIDDHSPKEIELEYKDEINDILKAILLSSKNNSESLSETIAKKDETRTEFLKKTNHETVFTGHDICFQYGRGKYTLKPFNLDLRLGEITAVVGENSSGKSTLIKVVAGEHLARSGNIQYPEFQHGATKLIWGRIKESIAYIPQEIHEWSGTVCDYLHFTATVKGITGKKNRDEVEYIIFRLGLQDFRDQSWKELSGGARMRVELANALIWKPKLLILDEPLANLDINAQAIFLRDLEQLANSHKYPVSVLITSQHLYEIENISDRMVFIEKRIDKNGKKTGEVVYNDLTKNFGQARTENTYEFSCDANFDEIRLVLSKHGITNMTLQGMNYIIKTDLKIDSLALLKLFVEHNISMDYFRDISTSTRTLF